MSDEILVARRGRELHLTLNRPANRNALTFAMMATLAEELQGAAAAGADVVVLEAAPGAFCAGNDETELAVPRHLDDDAPPLLMLKALREIDAVVVAAVDGPSVGVGATLLLLFDLVYATSASSLRFPFVQLGLVPEAASTLLLPRIIGHQRASEAMLLGHPVDAATAFQWGLLNAVLDSRAALDATVAQVVGEILDAPSAAVLATRRLLRDETAVGVETRMELDSTILRDLLRRPLAARTKER